MTALNVTTTNNLTLSGVISEGVAGKSLTKLGASTLTLSNNANSYTGTTSIALGTLVLNMAGDIGVSTNSVIGNAASALVVGTAATNAALTSNFQFVSGSDATNYTMSRGLDFSQGTSTAATVLTFASEGAGGANTNTLTLSGAITLGASRQARFVSQRTGMQINITGAITGAAVLSTGGFPADPNVDGHGTGSVRFSNLPRTYTGSNLLIMGAIIIDGTVGALATNSPIGQATIDISQGSGGNIVGGANFSGGNASHDVSPDTNRAIFLESAGSSYARILAPGVGSTTNPLVSNYGSTVNVINSYQFGGKNTSGTVTFSGAINVGDFSVGSSATNPITVAANVALIAENGGGTVFSAAISDTPDAATTARVTINQVRNHPNIDGTNNAGTTVVADGNPDTLANNGAAFTANALVGTAKTGTVALNAANTFVGTVEILGGTLQLGNAKALGFGGRQSTTTGTTTVTSGTVLNLNGITLVNEPIILNGTGISSAGALINNSGTAASIVNGIAGIQLLTVSTGSGYSTAPTVTIGGAGTGATATAQLGLTTASITSITSGGTGWVTGDTVNGPGHQQCGQHLHRRPGSQSGGGRFDEIGCRHLDRQPSQHLHRPDDDHRGHLERRRDRQSG